MFSKKKKKLTPVCKHFQSLPLGVSTQLLLTKFPLLRLLFLAFVWQTHVLLSCTYREICFLMRNAVTILLFSVIIDYFGDIVVFYVGI